MEISKRQMKLITELYNKGLSLQQIAVETKLPEPTIDSRLKILRREGKITYRNKPWSDSDVQELLELRACGLQYKTIASVTGRSIDAIKKKAAAMWKKQSIDKWYDEFNLDPVDCELKWEEVITALRQN